MADFDRAVKFVLANEGGFIDHHVDEGGPTNYGITMGLLSKWRKGSVSSEDVFQMPFHEAIDIYREVFWNVMMLYAVDDDDVATIVMDNAVNQGISIAAKRIQRIVHSRIDGAIGPATARAINAFIPKIRLVHSFVKSCQLNYVRIVEEKPAQIAFLEGWINRTHKYLDLVA